MTKSSGYPNNSVTTEKIMENISFASESEAKDKTISNKVVSPSVLNTFERVFNKGNIVFSDGTYIVPFSEHNIKGKVDVTVYDDNGTSLIPGEAITLYEVEVVINFIETSVNSGNFDIVINFNNNFTGAITIEGK